MPRQATQDPHVRGGEVPGPERRPGLEASTGAGGRHAPRPPPGPAAAGRGPRSNPSPTATRPPHTPAGPRTPRSARPPPPPTGPAPAATTASPPPARRPPPRRDRHRAARRSPAPTPRSARRATSPWPSHPRIHPCRTSVPIVFAGCDGLRPRCWRPRLRRRSQRLQRSVTRVPCGMLITTAFDFPGYDILAVQGEIFGITVRARNIGAGCVAGLRSLFGGEIPEFTKLLAQSRNEAMARMVEEARRRGPMPSSACVSTRERSDSGARSAPTARVSGSSR